MRVFISAGEPSGDLHASNLIRALRARRADVETVGFGGHRSAAAGCRLLYPLANLAVMGITQVALQIATFVKLLRRADRVFRDDPPDAVVLIDYPGFHWWLARRAKARGIPVIWYVPPQLWAWAGWRVARMRKHVDRILCSLPFEPAWYHARGVGHAEFVGHPFFDEVRHRVVDAGFLLEQSARGGPIVAILPGSREGELHRNGRLLLNAAARVAAARPDTRFLVACYKREHAERMAATLRQSGLELPQLEIHHGVTPEILRLARVAWSVSGSVSLELMAEALPTCIVFKVNPFYVQLAKYLVRIPYITLVNLLAGRAIMPEFLTSRDVSAELADQALRWLEHPEARERVASELAELRDQVATVGASARAADVILEQIAAPRPTVRGPHATRTTRPATRADRG